MFVFSSRRALLPYTSLFRSGRAFPQSLWRRRSRIWRGAGSHRGGRTLSLRPQSDVSRAHAKSWKIGKHTSELQSPDHLVCRLLLEKKKKKTYIISIQHVNYG